MGNRRSVFMAASCGLLSLFLAQAAWSQMGGTGGHVGQMGGQAGPGTVGAGPKPDPGEVLNQGSAGGYTIRFHNMPMKMEGVTNHLMVYVLGADGKAVLGAKVAYEITGPDGNVQRVMCMAMGNGYGGNVDLSKSGKYVIKFIGGFGVQDLHYAFEYNVK